MTPSGPVPPGPPAALQAAASPAGGSHPAGSHAAGAHAAAPHATASRPPASPVAGPTRTALWLGYGGLVPFVAGAALSWLPAPEARALAGQAMVAYAAVIVSFLGGIHWGIGFRDRAPRLFVWGVVPSLIAAAALLLPPPQGLAVLGSTLLLCQGVDRRLYTAHGLQAWLGLRWRLSLVAAATCLIGAAAG